MGAAGDLRALMDGSGVVELLPVGAVVCAATGELLYYNGRAVELWGRKPERFDPLERFTGAARLVRLDGTTLPPEDAPLALALRTGETRDVHETIVERPDGRTLRVHSLVRLLGDDDGTTVAAIEVFHERAEVRVASHPATEDLMNAVREIGRQTAALRDRAVAATATMKAISGAVEGLVDLSAVARDIAIRFAARARSIHASIHVDAAEPVEVVADRIRIDEVLAHALDSALRYTPGGPVDVRVIRSQASAELSVSGRGVGPTFTVSLPLAAA